MNSKKTLRYESKLTCCNKNYEYSNSNGEYAAIWAFKQLETRNRHFVFFDESALKAQEAQTLTGDGGGFIFPSFFLLICSLLLIPSSNIGSFIDSFILSFTSFPFQF